MSKERNVIVFSHKSDIDGMAPVILSKLVFNRVNYHLCEKTDLLQYITSSIETDEIFEADYVFVTDISITEKELNLLSDERLKDKVYVFDHHKASLDIDLKNYPFMTARFEDDNGICSGTSLFYEFLIKNGYIKPSFKIESFVELVRRYDTWEWKKYKDKKPRDLTILFECIGHEKFIDSMIINLAKKQDQQIKHILIALASWDCYQMS